MSHVDLGEAVEAFSAHILGRINVALPGIVMSYDGASRTATVRPAVRSHFIDEDTEERFSARMPPIPRVPVLMPRFGEVFEVHAPLTAGDPVLLVFCDRSIDEYVATGQADNTPQDVRRFDLSDAVAIPTTFRVAPAPTARLTVDEDGNVALARSGGVALRLNADQTVFIGNSAVSLVDTTNDLRGAVAQLSTALTTFAGALGSSVPASAGAAGALTTALGTVDAALAAVNGALSTLAE